MVANTYNPSSRKIEVGRRQAEQGQPRLHNKYQARLAHKTPVWESEKKKGKGGEGGKEGTSNIKDQKLKAYIIDKKEKYKILNRESS